MKAENYEISDTLWGRVTDYTSAVWESWGKDVDEYVEDVMDTNKRSDDELYASTVLQDAVHSGTFAVHLVSSVVSNDYTKERARELGSALASTEGYGSAKETIEELESAMNQATEQFMQEHPKVQTAFMASEEKLEEVTAYVTKEAKNFATNHPEITHDFEAIVKIASIVPAVKAVKIANNTTESISTVSTLGYLDKAQKYPVEFSTPTGKELNKWQEIVRPNKEIDLDSSQAVLNADTNTPSWMWDKSFSIEGVKESIQTKSLEPLEFNVGIQGAEKLAKVLGQKPEFVQISTEGKPLGMMLMVKDYKNHVTDENSGFVWYLESAPKGYVDKVLDIDKNEFDIKPGAALLDTASVKSLEAGRKDVMLHADPEGGDGLLKYYDKQKYEQVGKDKSSNITGISQLGRDNDGRYFHQDSTNAESYLKENRASIGQEYNIKREETPLGFNKTDMALATAATVVVASEREETSYNTTEKAQEIIGNMFPQYQTEYTQEQTREQNNTSYNNDLPESINNYLEQFSSNDAQMEQGQEIEL